MKHAIIPTDFSIASLQTVHHVMFYYKEEEVRITLLHLVSLPDSIPHLLFKRHSRYTNADIPTEFIQAREVIANKYDGHLAEIRTVIQSGETKAYLENLLEGLKGDAAFIPAQHTWISPFSDSINAIELCRKCKFPVIESPAQPRTEAKRFASIGDLLLVPQEQ